MSSALFFEVRNDRLAQALRATLDGSYASKVNEWTGIVLSASEVLVSNQRYELSGMGSGAAMGGNLLVQNIGRAAAAVYAPLYGVGSSVVIRSSSGGGGGTIPLPDTPGWNTINNGSTAGADLRLTAGVMQRAGNGILLFNGGGAVLREFAATDAGLDLASAAAAAGDLVLLPLFTLAGNHTLTAGVHYAGSSRRGTILSGQITGAAGATLEHLSITRTANDANVLAALVGPAAGICYVTDCELAATQAGAGTGYAIAVGNGDVYVYDSSLYGSTALTTEGLA
jgi:hypothetical protein